MTFDELKKTRWWKRWTTRFNFLPSNDVIERVKAGNVKVKVRYEPAGDPYHRWAIRCHADGSWPGAWLDGYDTQANALKACERMGWTVVE